jgi:glucose/arabinose dehydrogenase
MFRKIRQSILFLFIIPLLSFTFYCNNNLDPGNPSDIELPPGFKIEVYAENIPNARSMALSPEGVLFVGTRESKVYAVLDTNKDYRADNIITIADGLNSPNGVAFRNGDLYVAEISKVWRYDNIVNNLNNPPDPVLINDGFPGDTHHGWKFIAFSPDDKLYVPVGAPCNICLRDDDERFTSIMRMNPDGSDLEVFVSGIRNTVGFDWHPETGVLWFTDNGRDWLGDNTPPDELNRAPEMGMHFGYPFMHGQDIRDPEFGEGVDLSKFTKPVQNLGPHVAALGMRFYTGNMFPEEYRNQIFIAEHGSWNRSKKIGYRVMMVKLEGTEAVSYEPFAEGWLQGESVSGRPVDVLIMDDGSMLVSDDYGGVIYRITYSK